MVLGKNMREQTKNLTTDKFNYIVGEQLSDLEARYKHMQVNNPDVCPHKAVADVSGGWGTLRCFQCGDYWLR